MCKVENKLHLEKNMGCADQIFVLTSLISLYITRKKKLFLTFIDYEKAFDRVDHGLFWTEMQSVNIKGRVLEVIRNLHQKTNACDRVNVELSDVFNCLMGVRQGIHCHLYCLYFTITILNILLVRRSRNRTTVRN